MFDTKEIALVLLTMFFNSHPIIRRRLSLLLHDEQRLRKFWLAKSDQTVRSLATTKNKIHYPPSFYQHLEKHPNSFYTLQTLSTNFLPKSRYLNTSNQSSIVPFVLPDIGEGISEVVIKGWMVKVGDEVREFDEICEVESDKASVTISSRYNGTIVKIHYGEGVTAKVGKPLLDIELSDGSSVLSQTKKDESSSDRGIGVNKAMPNQPSADVNEMKNASQDATAIIMLPSVRRLSKQYNIDLSTVKATGKDGRLRKEDILSAIEEKKFTLSCEATSVATNKDQLDTIDYKKREERIAMNNIQLAMLKTMTQALKIPHFGYSDEINVTKLKSYLSSLKRQDIKISLLAVIIKMTSLALTKFPQLNASIDEEAKVVVVKNYHNIGVAVDTRNGLLVPNIKNVQNLSVFDINSELLRLRELGYNSKLMPIDLSGGTFTLSNIGSIGGIYGIPVILPPEIVIGALGKVQRLPRFESSDSGIDVKIEGQDLIQVVWSADHRIVDGATLSRFSNLLKSYLEDPRNALLEMK